MTNFNQVAAQQQQRVDQQRRDSLGIQQGKPQQVEPGTLYVTDTYMPSVLQSDQATPPHGLAVQAAARSTGFNGKIELREFPSARYMSYDASRHDPAQSPRAASYLDGLRRQTQERYQQVLIPATDQLNELSDGGVKNSALNISMGTGRARIAEEAFEAIPTGKADLVGAAEAFGLDPAKLGSKDPKVFGPERARLQQAIINEVDRTASGSKSIQQAKQKYDLAVTRFESSHNSVVVSGGNDGEVLERFKRDNNGATLNIPKNFYDSPLVNDQVTVVGATDGDSSTRPAAYSQMHRENQIYASGTLPQMPGTGSSFASPRVAATMADLHRIHPEKSSDEIEALMIQKFGRPGQNTPVPVLDLGSTRQFLQDHKF